MKRSRFSEEQIITILREQEAGAKTADVCRKLRAETGRYIRPVMLVQSKRGGASTLRGLMMG